MPRVVHFEIHADDPDRAAKFYADLLGWEVKKWDGPVDYWLVTTGPESEKGIDGGIMKRQGDVPEAGNAVMAYVCTVEVDDVDVYAQKVTEAGGQIAVPKMAVPGIGWLVYAKDTEGNVFGMMQTDEKAQ